MASPIDLAPLFSGPIHWFADWPVADVPMTGSAVYTFWDRAGAFVYVGMSGRSATATGKGPWGRLHSHASGRRSGDQFCVYVSDRFVLATLHNRLGEISDGSLSLDAETRAFIRAHLGFRCLAVPTPADAWAQCSGATKRRSEVRFVASTTRPHFSARNLLTGPRHRLDC